MKVSAEKHIQSEILVKLKYSSPGTILFRNNVGQAIYGDARVPYGLTKGASDLIGWHTIEITPDMVGKRIAIFTAAEVKNVGWAPAKLIKDKSSRIKAQRNFIEKVRKAGGIAGFVRSLADMEKLLKEGI